MTNLAHNIANHMVALSDPSRQDEYHTMMLGVTLKQDIEKHHDAMMSDNPPTYRIHLYKKLIDALSAEIKQGPCREQEKCEVISELVEKPNEDAVIEKSNEDVVTEIPEDEITEKPGESGASHDDSSSESVDINAEFNNSFTTQRVKAGVRRIMYNKFVVFLRNAKQEEVPWYNENKGVQRTIIFDAYNEFCTNNFPDIPIENYRHGFWTYIEKKITTGSRKFGSRYVTLKKRANIKL